MNEIFAQRDERGRVRRPRLARKYVNPEFPPPGYLTIAEAARRIWCSGEAVRNRIDMGQLAAESFPRFPNSHLMALALKYEEVERYLDAFQAFIAENGIGPAQLNDRPWNDLEDKCSTDWK